jgi:hypothetical protein
MYVGGNYYVLLFINNINNTNNTNNTKDRLDQQIKDDAVPGTFSASFVVAAAAYVGETLDTSFLAVSI